MNSFKWLRKCPFYFHFHFVCCLITVRASGRTCGSALSILQQKPFAKLQDMRLQLDPETNYEPNRFELTLIYGNQTLQYLGSFGLAKAKDPFSGGVSKNRDEEWCFFLSWKTPKWNSRENPMAVRYLWPRCQIQRSGYIQFLLEDVGTPRNQSDRIGGPWQSIKLRVSCSLQFSIKALLDTQQEATAEKNIQLPTANCCNVTLPAFAETSSTSSSFVSLSTLFSIYLLAFAHTMMQLESA